MVRWHERGIVSDGTGRSIRWYRNGFMVQKGVSDDTEMSIRWFYEGVLYYLVVQVIADGTGRNIRWYR